MIYSTSRHAHLTVPQAVFQLQKNDFRRAVGSPVKMAQYFPSSLWKQFSSSGSTPRQVMLLGWPTGCNKSGCHGTTQMSLIVGDWMCSVIIKITMEPGTYSAYVLISWTQAIWHSLFGLWCNNKPPANDSSCFYPGFVRTHIICHLWADITVGLSVGLSICSESTCLHSKFTLGSSVLEEFVVKEGWRVQA